MHKKYVQTKQLHDFKKLAQTNLQHLLLFPFLLDIDFDLKLKGIVHIELKMLTYMKQHFKLVMMIQLGPLTDKGMRRKRMIIIKRK